MDEDCTVMDDATCFNDCLTFRSMVRPCQSVQSSVVLTRHEAPSAGHLQPLKILLFPFLYLLLLLLLRFLLLLNLTSSRASRKVSNQN